MKICFVTGKTFQSGNNVSHAVNKTRKKFSANIQKKTLFSSVLGNVTVKITPQGLRTLELKGGIDNYLMTSPSVYGDKGQVLLKRFQKASSKIELKKI